MRLFSSMLAFALFILAACGGQNQPAETAAQVDPQTEKLNQGRELFTSQCTACHAIHKELTGPALHGVTQRWQEKEKLYKFIRNSQHVVQEDEYAGKLWEKYNKTVMPPFPDLTNEQIDAILYYIETMPKP